MLSLAALLHSRTVNVGTFHAARPFNLLYHYTKAILDMFFTKLDAKIAVSEAARTFVERFQSTTGAPIRSFGSAEQAVN